MGIKGWREEGVPFGTKRFVKGLATDIAQERAWRREELETAWLRGHVSGERRAGKANKEVLQEAADYAERVVGGLTKPEGPDPEPFPSEAENAP
jgi:hypothetical protein